MFVGENCGGKVGHVSGSEQRGDRRDEIQVVAGGKTKNWSSAKQMGASPVF